MRDPDDNSAQAGLLDRLQRALTHAEGAARCYLALVAAEGRRLARRLMEQAVWVAGLVGFGLIGLALLAFGVATFLDSLMVVPGAGAMIVGGVIVTAVLVTAYLLRSHIER